MGAEWIGTIFSTSKRNTEKSFQISCDGQVESPYPDFLRDAAYPEGNTGKLDIIGKFPAVDCCYHRNHGRDDSCGNFSMLVKVSVLPCSALAHQHSYAPGIRLANNSGRGSVPQLNCTGSRLRHTYLACSVTCQAFNRPLRPAQAVQP